MEDKDNDRVLIGETDMETIKSKKTLRYFILLGILLLIIIIIIVIVVIKNKDDDDKEDENEDEHEEEEDDSKENENISWDESYKKAEIFISNLNLTEQKWLLYGTENMRFLFPDKTEESEMPHLCVGQIDALKNKKVDFKGMCLQDGPSGVRYAKGTGISWQAPINTAATFDKQLMYQIGKAQGEENKEKGINVFLSPCVNIMRNPQAGRVWEGFGEDPFYSGACATEIIKGIQDTGVIATIKHFVGNDQETYRHASSSNINKAALMDIYVEPFYRAIHQGNVGAMMSGYNAVNNTYCSENKELLTNILRNDLNFKGFVMSDWWAIYSINESNFNSGLDINMPGGAGWGDYYYGKDRSYWSILDKFVDLGKIPEERIKESATRIIATMYKFNQMENFPQTNLYKETKTEERKKLQRKAATESQILLKNEDNILPLRNINKLAIVGNDALPRDCGTDDDCGCKNSTNEVVNGNIPLGYGSGTTTFNYLVSPLEGITNLAEKKGISVESSCNLIYKDEIREVEGESITVHIEAKEDINKGVEIAKEAEVVIIFAKADSGEEFMQVENSIGDRPDLDLWHGANELIENITEVNNNTIVVINAPSVVNLPWLDKVKAVIFSGFPGAETGNAIADVLFGEVNPSGHLPYVWGELEDYGSKIPYLTNYTMTENNKTYKDEFRYDGIDCIGREDSSPNHDKEQYNYTEELYIGQRWFNKNNKKAIFPFGFGLSYTNFNYSDLKVKMSKEGLTAEFNVKNIGDVSGKAVPMMFLTFPENIGDYPKYIFKGFEKIDLEPNETKNVTIFADDHALSYFNVEQNKYIRISNGIIKVAIGENGDPDQAILKDEVDSKF